MAEPAAEGAPDTAGGAVRLSPQAAWERWTSACAAAGWRAVPDAEPVPVAAGLDRVTVAALRALWPSPRFSCAAMDGIALRAQDASPQQGTWRLAAPQFTWVDTGMPTPGGTDTVVERERVRVLPGGDAEISGPARRGQHVRLAGEDFRAGQELLPAGHRLRPADLAVAAASGHATLHVARRPAVAIIPTGDEIRPAGADLGAGGVVDSNSVMLAARTSQAGGTASVSSVQRDEPEAIAAEVARAAAAADLVLILAGSSAGDRDHTAAVIAQAGELTVRGAAVRPGHPVLLGHARRAAQGGPVSQGRLAPVVPVIGVPGYPLAAAVIFELFAVPLLAALQGMPPPRQEARQARLARAWTSSPEVEDWVPVTLAAAPPGAEGCPVLATPSRRGAGAISQFLHADAWWPIPVGQGSFAGGDLIEVRPLPGGPSAAAAPP